MAFLQPTEMPWATVRSTLGPGMAIMAAVAATKATKTFVSIDPYPPCREDTADGGAGYCIKLTAYSRGVTAVTALKTRVKWLWSQNPQSRATPEMSAPCRRSSFARSIRRLIR